MDIEGIGTPIEVSLMADLKVIEETLTRCGIVNKKRKIIYPSCYIVEQFGKYYIFHFKELFSITRSNYYNNISEEDIHRKNAIVYCLKQWGLIDTDSTKIEPHDMFVFVLPHSKKMEYCVNHKFNTASLKEAN
jgi:hypothetical protein|tara:strand:- start:193 stop:591 length:399 start_codon:yes stop_codon:yes gene_type:complete